MLSTMLLRFNYNLSDFSFSYNCCVEIEIKEYKLIHTKQMNSADKLSFFYRLVFFFSSDH